MEVKCPAICNDATVRRLLGRKYPAALKRFDTFVLEAYLKNNPSVKWCPSAPHCGRAIRVDTSDLYWEVECPCGVSFCFKCASPAHSPVPCSMWDQWDAKFRGESENLKWISLNTKSCPGCHKPIEKNGGCNHVSCPCGMHLCYACGQNLAGHTCNRYDEKKAASYDAIRRQMMRYNHYCDRFNVHLNSRKVEEDTLWQSIHKRVLQLESSVLIPGLLRDASWLARAHRSLLMSRLVLSRSYAFAYYMFGDEVRTEPSERANLAMAKELFENQQEQLECNAERLSKVLAAEAAPVLAEEEVRRTMGKTANLSDIVNTHCREMYTCIQDELLPLLVEPMNIAPYRPDGPDKAKELPA
jgi:ariadne-1